MRATLERLGVECQTIAVAAQGFNPFGGYRLKRDLADTLRALRLGALAITDLELLPLLAATAQRARVPHIVPMLEDFPPEGAADKSLRKAFEAATGLILATDDAARRATRSGWLDEAMRIDVLPSAGADLVALPTRPLPPTQDGLTFLLITSPTDRIAQETFAAAAEEVRQRHPSARFPVAKDLSSPSIAMAHVVVHAGTVDGLAAGLVAGLATARAIITTDVAGARETVDERVNGCLIAPADAHALAEAMLTFLRRPDQLPAMARASRSKAERRFDARAVDGATLAALGLGESFAAAA